MCHKPYKIKNPNLGLKSFGFKDVESQYIDIPCGHCAACLHLKQEYFIQRFQMECINNDLWTGMLSYNRDMLPIAIVNGFRHSFADSRDVQLLTRRLRNDNVFGMPFKYWFISERGSKKHRPHWHFLISTPKIPGETLSEKLSREKKYHDVILSNWYYNAGSKRVPIKVPLLTYTFRNGRRNYDFHYVNPSLTQSGSLDVGFYTSKYYLKDDKYTNRLRSALKLNLSDDCFSIWWHFLKNKHLCSHFLGDPRDPDIYAHIRKGIDISLSRCSPFPFFINPQTGQTFPLSPFYRSKVCTIDDLRQFYNNSDSIDGVHLTDIDIQAILNADSRLSKIQSILDNKDVDYSQICNDDFLVYGDFAEDYFLSEGQTPMDKNSCADFTFTDFYDNDF